MLREQIARLSIASVFWLLMIAPSRTVIDKYAGNTQVRTELSVDGNIYKTVCYHEHRLPSHYTCNPGTSNVGRWVRLLSIYPPTNQLNLKDVKVMASYVVGRGRFKQVKSLKSMKGTGSVLQTRPVVIDTQCDFFCALNSNCLGVNIINGTGGMDCQLLGSFASNVTNEENITFWKMDD